MQATARRSEYKPPLTKAIKITRMIAKALGIASGSSCIAIPAQSAPIVIEPSSDNAIVPLFSENMPPKATIVKIEAKAKRKEIVDSAIIISFSPLL